MFYVFGGVITNRSPLVFIAKTASQAHANTLADAFAAPIGHVSLVRFIPASE